ncbi:hypothetical protein FisN_10Lh163 [Fistulifera solaris]|uniref:EF-hand domain-containing protein n=1 Tax=Fistulifera solaris TaxID=1519565 RepID=A0A1Z5JTF7_FISSO|nr:hypothetical protein FisN_10Lh163 [Fistulifera solaris]|eukprot:GAX17300.1 hypothetical protein FisN_10Lh163 [Fistulifera solaris]
MSSSNSQGETKALLDTGVVSTAAAGGANFFNQAAQTIQQAQKEGPLTFRILGFLGGLAMIVSNGLAILERFFSFSFARSLMAVYGVIFGVIIVFMDAPFPIICSQKIQTGIHSYAKFLDYTWGRGLFFFFVGTLQVSNVNMLDWAVGGFMIFVGVVAMGVGMATANQMRLVRFAVKDESTLKQKWKEHDANGDGSLDVKELTAFVNDAGVTMTRNEIAAFYLALDKNFDQRIAYEEFYAWWTRESDHSSRVV